MPFCSNCGNKIEDEAKFCSNCGAKVASSDMDSAISNNLNKTGTVIVHRGNAMQDVLRSYIVFIDGKEVGKIKQNEEQQNELNYGKHVIQFKIDWKGSKLLEFELNDDSPIVCVNCRGYSKFGTIFESGKALLGANDNYILAVIDDPRNSIRKYK